MKKLVIRPWIIKKTSINLKVKNTSLQNLPIQKENQNSKETRKKVNYQINEKNLKRNKFSCYLRQ